MTSMIKNVASANTRARLQKVYITYPISDQKGEKKKKPRTV